MQDADWRGPLVMQSVDEQDEAPLNAIRGQVGIEKAARFVVIGTGFAGTLMAIKLLERGHRDIVVLEKAARMGGTWRDNTYPGVACDVAAHTYCYSFERNPWWKRRYADGADIWKYHHGVARKYGVLPYIRYDAEVCAAEFDGREWCVRTTDGREFLADVVVSAVGRLHRPVLPDIPGRDSFAGPAFHTAVWDHSLDLTGKRVGMIGTGSTATQLVVALAERVSRLSVFQRTAQWVHPVKNTLNPWWRKLAFRFFPAYWRKYYLQLRDESEERAQETLSGREGRMKRDQVCYDALAGIADPELRRKLTPDYEVGCKRLVFSDGFFEAIQKPSIDLVVAGIERIEAGGIRAKDGRLHELDALIFATGFDAHANLKPIKITGRGGISLDTVWTDLPVNYETMMIPQMPNFFMINGPYSPIGSGPVIGTIEAQVHYLIQVVDRIVGRDVLLAPCPEAARRWLDGVRHKARESVWGSGGCRSWYLDETGVPALDPSSPGELRERLARPAWEDFIEEKRPSRAGEAN